MRSEPLRLTEEPRDETPGTAALCIATLAEDLAQLARRHSLDTLAYLLDMARLEADEVLKSVSHPADRR